MKERETCPVCGDRLDECGLCESGCRDGEDDVLERADLAYDDEQAGGF